MTSWDLVTLVLVNIMVDDTLVPCVTRTSATTGWETSACPLANASENLAGRVENRPGRVEFCIGSGNGLLLDGAKPLPELMLTSHQ